jgi:hypothetical protein
MQLSTKHPLSIVMALALLGAAIHYAGSAYGATNDKLDVNLNVIYIGSRSQKDAPAMGEQIIQFPFPLSQHARDTGQGLFGGITYFDNKTIVSDTSQLVSQIGLGRIYYSYSVPGETPYTFVPFVTLYRELWYSYKDSANANGKIKGKSIMLPGALYTYRFDERYAFHFDTELYSYSERTNNRTRIGFSYSPNWPWIISVSHEQLSWDIDSGDISADGEAVVNNIKVIYRDPPQGNFALTIGRGYENRNSVGASLLNPGTNNNRGLYFGVEASAGVLAW